MADNKLRNWSKNVVYSASEVRTPKTIPELQDLVAHNSKVKALGSRHSFSRIADTTGLLISMELLQSPPELDSRTKQVRVGAGTRYGELCPWLEAQGWALHNLPSLPHISVAGACATATHGSGVRNGNLATAVAGMKSIVADGSLREIQRSDPGSNLEAMAVGLGAFGVVTEVTLDVQPSFMMSQRVYEDLPASDLANHFDEIMAASYSVSLFLDWKSPGVDQVWVKSRADEKNPIATEKNLFGAKAATAENHPIRGCSAENCTPQRGVPRPWYEILPHFRLDKTPSAGDELQSEIFVPRARALEAMAAIRALGEEVSPLVLVSEIRSVAADRLWMSPAYERDSIAIHFTWKPDEPGVRALLPKLEKALEPFQPRPHWGKIFSLSSSTLRSRYPRFEDFRRVVLALDPGAKFQNPFMKDILGKS